MNDHIYTDDILERMSLRQLEHYRETLSAIGKRSLDIAVSDIYRRKRRIYKQSEEYRTRQELIKPNKRSIFGFNF